MAKEGFAKVLFNAPICIALDPPESEKPLGHPDNRPHHFTYQEIQEMTRRYKAEGWDERAIVVKAEMHAYGRVVPANWGVIVDLVTHQGVLGQPYYPLKVRWVMSGDITHHWPEDLLFIHEAVSERTLEYSFQLQEWNQ